MKTKPEESPMKRALRVITGLEKQLDDLKREPIAITGMGCRIPGGANDPDSFWRLLREGRDAVSEVPRDRYDIDDYFDPDPDSPGKVCSRRGGFLDRIDGFDPYFFGISVREAESLDPQQRMLLEVSWEAFEDAGLPLEKVSGAAGGVFVGILTFDYTCVRLEEMETLDAYATTGMAHSTAVGRISYFFDLHGPCLAIDGACSSSLLSLHSACQSLRARECDFALAGGVSAILSPFNSILMTKLKTLAPDGRCKAFDHRADGYVRAEGCGLVVLKRLSDAIRDGDRIRAVIRGSAINQDGRSNGLTAPNGIAQEAMIRRALQVSGVGPEKVGLVETHGAGTSLGDPIEVDALKAVYGTPRDNGLPLALGALKSNVGHLEPAAGIAGLIKTVLALENREIPPNLHFEKLNPHIDLNGTPLVIPTRLTEWPAPDGGPRFAGVSAFGVNGTNAHIVLEEYTENQISSGSSEDRSRRLVLPLSARTEPALRDLAHAWRDFLPRASASLDDLCFSAANRRSQLEHRLTLTGRNRDELVGELDAYLAGTPGETVFFGKAPTGKPGLVFLFSGQGPNWWPVHETLLKIEPVHAVLKRCDRLIRDLAGWSLLEQLTADPATSKLHLTQYTQPALFAIQIAIAEWWRSLGAVPDLALGHSMGEVAAAHVAGALGLEDALTVIHHRGRLIQTLCGKGKMAYVELSFDEARSAIRGHEDRLSVAVENGPRSSVLSGEPEALAEVVRALEAEEIFCRPLESVDFASHGPQMEAIQDDMRDALTSIQPKQGEIPFISTVHGRETDGSVLDAGYWSTNLRATVRFRTAMHHVLERGRFVFAELAPHPVLAASAKQVLAERGAPAAVLPSLHREIEPETAMLASFGGLHVAGYPVDWSTLFPGRGRYVPLPAYPWQRESFPVHPPRKPRSRNAAEPWEPVQTALKHQSRLVPYDLDLRTPARPENAEPAGRYLQALVRAALTAIQPPPGDHPLRVLEIVDGNSVWVPIREVLDPGRFELQTHKIGEVEPDRAFDLVIVQAHDPKLDDMLTKLTVAGGILLSLQNYRPEEARKLSGFEIESVFPEPGIPLSDLGICLVAAKAEAGPGGSLFGTGTWEQPRVSEPADIERRETEGVNREALALLDPETRRARVAEYLTERVCREMRVPVDRLDPERTLNEMGLDSLMAIRIRNALEADLGLTLPVARLMRGAGLPVLIDDLVQRLVPEENEDQALFPIPDRPAERMHDADVSEPVTVDLQAPVSLNRVRDTAAKLVERHPMLGAVFSGDRWSLKPWDGEERDWVVTGEKDAWDLARGPLFRVLAQMDDDLVSSLKIAAHPSLAGPGSLAVLARELAGLSADPDTTCSGMDGDGEQMIADDAALLGTPLEGLLAYLFGSVLDKQDVSIHDSFYDTGGSSMDAFVLADRIRDSVRVDLTPEQIFLDPTPSRLASVIEQTHPPETVSVVPVRPDPEAGLRLICLPYLGGGSPFLHLFGDVPDGIEVLGLLPPGREGLLLSRPFQRFQPAVEALLDAMRPYLDKPFVLLGHSLGALYAFELARALRDKGLPEPAHLCVSSMPAPRLVRENPVIQGFSPDNVSDLARNWSGVDLDDPEMLAMALPLLRADLAVLHDYEYWPGPRLETGVSVFAGEQDAMLSKPELEAWREQTNGSFSLETFPGDHFYVFSQTGALVQSLARALETLHRSALSRQP